MAIWFTISADTHIKLNLQHLPFTRKGKVGCEAPSFLQKWWTIRIWSKTCSCVCMQPWHALNSYKFYCEEAQTMKAPVKWIQHIPKWQLEAGCKRRVEDSLWWIPGFTWMHNVSLLQRKPVSTRDQSFSKAIRIGIPLEGCETDRVSTKNSDCMPPIQLDNGLHDFEDDDHQKNIIAFWKPKKT